MFVDKDLELLKVVPSQAGKESISVGVVPDPVPV